ncbi:PD-(D/E)XK nuclease family protein [Candidatus Skiveiella danica]|uniref:PD-(D/E)XK nuclease family protein n=1 Tax=Candidatus Skiveiella danica TaxID=3386177 RepID=UPI0039B975A6
MLHRAMAAWPGLMGRLAQRLEARGAHPARTLVLLPFAQLMPVAVRQWAACHPDGFAPRFETTRNWARQLAPFSPGPDDLSFDPARDLPLAQNLLERAGLGAQRDVLASALVESATQLAALAAARAPDERLAWAAEMTPVVGGAESGPLAFEAAVARLALVWAATSAQPTDVLYGPLALDAVDAVFVLDGFQPDPLTSALAARWGERAETLALPLDAPRGEVRLFPAVDTEDEAERAAARVLAHIKAGRVPVALAATDRALTRRVRALLGARGVAIRDENGWKLSTTRVAAELMALLRALAWNASSDDVLDALKNTPTWGDEPTRLALEAWLRRQGLRDWRDAERLCTPDSPDARASALAPRVADIAAVRSRFGTPRPLAAWLGDLRALLHNTGLAGPMALDAAGVRLLGVLRLEEGAQAEFADVRGAARRLSLSEFTSWVDAVLEAASHVPPHPAREQVTILPLSQMLARPFAALVLPGCDDVRLPAAPEPPGPWTATQRAALGLPSRAELGTAHRAAWAYALQAPACDILWRQGDDSGEPLLPSRLVQALLLEGLAPEADDPRPPRELTAAPVPPPTPSGAALPVKRISASAYGDLRACPYRFFALRQLGLQEADELDAEVDKRDFGLWLHAVLRRFHEALRATPTADPSERQALIDQAAMDTTREHGLDDGDFLPFAAVWPAVRDGYLAWLTDYDATGGHFERAEAEGVTPLGAWQLHGRLDRVDRGADGQTLVIDYKTEGRQRTADRIKDAAEDTQLAFYAALLPDDSLRAAYLNVGDRDGTKLYEQADVTALRDRLLAGIQSDLQRIADGHAMPALGEGSACEWCAARGLCRKDSWAVPATPTEEGAT